ncbi:MAG TPA: IS21-like element helper ATPase IstB [Tepidisphaeraceae bacterium]|jgi:DNA replication protein DnaC|nr:IS21-like element helper ATPase IstB [Tepidisphaeraceae bacterium]
MSKGNTVLLESHLKTLRLPTFVKEYAKAAKQSGERGDSHELFLEHLAELEVNQRDSKASIRRLKQAGFPVDKDLSEFDFTAVPGLSRKKMLDLFTCRFIEEKSSVVLLGAPGVGKSHLAVALGREACRKGHGVKFFTASHLVNTYLEAREQRQVMRLESNIRKKDLIIVDELGYLPMDTRGAEHLFGFFSQCYEQVSLVVTTNLPFAEWPSIFAGDARLAGAVIDRLTHRVHIVEIAGESYRLKQSLKAKEGGDAKAAAKS